MKGGITSGVVYPSAVVELAKTHRFRSIGGTSAGVIAAAATAAAEYGRREGTGGFEELESLPTWLAQRILGRVMRDYLPVEPHAWTFFERPAGAERPDHLSGLFGGALGLSVPLIVEFARASP